MATFKHSGNAGDILYSLYAIASQAISEGKRQTLYIALDVQADYAGRHHPLGNVMCNQKIFDMLYPLLVATDLFEQVEVYKGQEVDYDLDKFRFANIDLGRGDITKWYSVVYPDLMPNTSDKLIQLYLPHDGHPSPYIAVNRTFRYRNADVRYKALNETSLDVFFLGLPDEYEDFKLRVPKAIYRPVTNFLEAALIIQRAQYFIGNQSMMFAIAELMNKTRILEVYKHAPNVIPNGGEWYTVINEEGLKKAMELT